MEAVQSSHDAANEQVTEVVNDVPITDVPPEIVESHVTDTTVPFAIHDVEDPNRFAIEKITDTRLIDASVSPFEHMMIDIYDFMVQNSKMWRQYEMYEVEEFSLEVQGQNNRLKSSAFYQLWFTKDSKRNTARTAPADNEPRDMRNNGMFLGRGYEENVYRIPVPKGWKYTMQSNCLDFTQNGFLNIQTDKHNTPSDKLVLHISAVYKFKTPTVLIDAEVVHGHYAHDWNFSDRAFQVKVVDDASFVMYIEPLFTETPDPPIIEETVVIYDHALAITGDLVVTHNDDSTSTYNLQLTLDGSTARKYQYELQPMCFTTHVTWNGADNLTAAQYATFKYTGGPRNVPFWYTYETPSTKIAQL